VQRHWPRQLVNREGRPRGLVRCEGWPTDLRRKGWSRDLRHEGRCRDIGPGTSSIVKVGPGAWSDAKVGLETLDVKVGPETSDMKVGAETSVQGPHQSLRSAQGPGQM